MPGLGVIQLVSLTVLTGLLVLCVVGIVSSSEKLAVQLKILIFGSLLIYIDAWVAWWSLIYDETVPISRILAYFKIFPWNQPIWFSRLVILAPPLIPVLVLVSVFFYTRWHATGNRIR
jgi:hypothetical protein